MADTIRVVPSSSGADPAVATDDIAGIHYQKIKAGWGADGVWNETTDTDGIRLPVGGAQVGAINETAPASDIANAGLNGRLQRVAQRLTSLMALLPTSLGQKTMANGLAVTIASDQSAVPVSGTVTANAGSNLNTSLLVTETNDAARQGGVLETAPATDTGSSGLNGRLQRVAQRVTSLIALLPPALGAGGGLKVDGSGVAMPVSGTFWQATQPVSGTVTANQGGTWTVQPGNTANTTAWKVDGSAVTQPVSGAVTATVPANAAATAVDAGDEPATDEAIVGAAANTRLVGFSARETTGTAGSVFKIRHGTSNAGALLVTVSLGVGESAREWYGPDGIAAASGLWLERVSGTTEFVGYYKVAV